MQPSVSIVQCDFRELLSRVAQAGGCDLIFTSPPYDDARDYGNDVNWSFKDYQELGDHVAAALVPGGHCLMILDGPVRMWRPVGTERSLTPFRVMLDWADRCGLRVPDRLAYARHGAPGAYTGRFRNDWEPLMWFQRPGVTGYFDKWPLAGKFSGDRGASSVRKVDGTMFRRERSGKAVEEGLSHRGTLWSYGNTGGAEEDATGHPARFDARVARDAILCFCPPNGVVCDPFVGSGTTAVEAVKAGRRFVGGDAFADAKGKPWAEVSIDRDDGYSRPTEVPGAPYLRSALVWGLRFRRLPAQGCAGFA